MRKFSLTLAAIAALGFSVAQAHAVSFNFSFTNQSPLGDVNGTVTGRIDGLADTGASAATAVFITSIPPLLSYPFSASDNLLAQPSVTVVSNSFTVTSGVLTAMDFRAGFPIANTTPAETFFLTLLLNPGSFFVANRISDAVDHKVESLISHFRPCFTSPTPRRTPALRHRPRRVGSAWLAQEAEAEHLTTKLFVF